MSLYTKSVIKKTQVLSLLIFIGMYAFGANELHAVHKFGFVHNGSEIGPDGLDCPFLDVAGGQIIEFGNPLLNPRDPAVPDSIAYNVDIPAGVYSIDFFSWYSTTWPYHPYGASGVPRNLMSPVDGEKFFLEFYNAAGDYVRNSSYSSDVPDDADPGFRASRRHNHLTLGEDIKQIKITSKYIPSHSLHNGSPVFAGCIRMADITAGDVCGDGITALDLSEQCDDGNSIDDDWCSNSCTSNIPVDGMACPFTPGPDQRVVSFNNTRMVKGSPSMQYPTPVIINEVIEAGVYDAEVFSWESYVWNLPYGIYGAKSRKDMNRPQYTEQFHVEFRNAEDDIIGRTADSIDLQDFQEPARQISQVARNLTLLEDSHKMRIWFGDNQWRADGKPDAFGNPSVKQESLIPGCMLLTKKPPLQCADNDKNGACDPPKDTNDDKIPDYCSSNGANKDVRCDIPPLKQCPGSAPIGDTCAICEDLDSNGICDNDCLDLDGDKYCDPECGNEITEPSNGEECDAGPSGNDACSSRCKLKTTDPSVGCTVNRCDGAQCKAIFVPGETSGAACNSKCSDDSDCQSGFYLEVLP